MLFSADRLAGCSIVTRDGSLGSVSDVYFNEVSWIVEYIVVSTGRWLSGREVLLTPFMLGSVDIPGRRLQTYLSREQVRNSPHVSNHKPVSHLERDKLYVYWRSMARASTISAEPDATPFDDGVSERWQASHEAPNHLRSAEQVMNYYVEATNGDIGHVEDLLINDESWTIKQVVVETRNWLPGRKVLISPSHVAHFSWTERRVRLKLTREDVRRSPACELLGL